MAHRAIFLLMSSTTGDSRKAVEPSLYDQYGLKTIIHRYNADNMLKWYSLDELTAPSR